MTNFLKSAFITLFPTIIITDAKGEIVFVDLTDSYRIRPEPGTFFKILDGINL